MRHGSGIGAVAAALMLVSAPLSAQVARDSSVDWLVSAGSEAENYLRVLQVAGLAPLTQWSVRPFSATKLRTIAPSDSTHPWASQFRLRPASHSSFAFIQPEGIAILNTTFPYGYNDGPIWAGRGLTLAASGGVRGHYGPLSFTLAPQLFIAQNAGFPLAPNGRTGPQAFGDAYSFGIDLPQRFGDGAYGRFDPGQSSVQLSVARLALGASTANEYWGPAREQPFLLGNNAAGFAHAFLGTDGPLWLGPIQLNVRLIAGRLDQSAYSYAEWANRRRYISGVVAAIGVKQLPGLEIGGGRLFENVWPDTGFSYGDVIRPLFQSLLKTKLNQKFGNAGDKPDNQLASIFARWAFPESGVEVYGEYGREDNAWDTRDLLLEPDHDVAYLLGLARVWKRPGGRLLVVRGEVLNSAMTDLRRVRDQAPNYVHFPVVQGHTQEGQVLGAPSGFGGGSAGMVLDLYAPSSRLTMSWRRSMREPPPAPTFVHDVTHTVSMDGVFFRRRI
ncbi:MAG TPA: capsule assembly Wzi family protein, partial [Gemmatimonadaceae bacterium]|nr:capsule assembly Wzi family protein [Gemmatimonadaceae bacterium]